MDDPVTEIQQLNQEQSHDNIEYSGENDDGIKFQKFIYELFEKNGVLNDLRAHLRGHIITVLKSTGDAIPKCEKNFVQRLEYPYQAMNMLIAEYFLRMNFNYSLSVFVSEMPLANMAFDFAKSLIRLNPKDDVSSMTFKDSDIWSVLNYLGVQLDSEYAYKIREMYRQKEVSLLDCLLKCITLASLQAIHKQAIIKQTQTQILPELVPDDVSLTSSTSAKTAGSKQSGRVRKRAYTHDKCSHYQFCKSCRRRVARLKDKYKMRQSDMEKKTQEKTASNKDMEEFMKNISKLEKNLISEIFAQMKTVYDAEVEMVKTEEQKKVKRSVGSLVMQLRQKKAEMEEIYGAKVEELERSVEEKKRFLWGLARGLRAQHEQMARAMHRVKHETRRLTHKETLLKSQLLKAEEVIRRRGEQVRSQISHELFLLAKHLDSVKAEKELLKKERSDLEKAESNYRLLKLSNADNNYEDLHTRYDTLKTELAILKKYIDTLRTENKVTSETSTNTEEAGKEAVSLNNEQGVGRGEDRRAPNQVVNDLKKQKNVNFAQVNESLRSFAVSTSEDNHTQTQCEDLEKEYHRLREFAVMQRQQIEQLTSQYSVLQSELAAAKRAMQSRPQTAPSRLEPFYMTLHRASTSATLSGCGGGEQLTPLSQVATHRILVPGDTLPFVGVVGETNTSDSRKHLINQWRTLRHLSPVSKTRHASPAPREEAPTRHCSAHSKLTPNTDALQSELVQPNLEAKAGSPELRQREKSPKSMLREAKARLRNKDASKKCQSSQGSREKSPTAVLREAKLRLRKLEIEAEAVEKSYKDFRKKQEASNSKLESGYSSPHSKTANVQTIVDASQATRKSCERILKDYSDRYEAYFKNRNVTSVRASPVPKEMAQIDRANKLIDKINDNYLDKPLAEFRKLYEFPTKESKEAKLDANKQTTETITVLQHKASREKSRAEHEMNREAQYEILQQNINKIYNLDEPTACVTKPVVTLHQAEPTEWEKSEQELKIDGGRMELKVSLVCEDDEVITKPDKTELTVDLNSGLLVDCPTDNEIEVEEFIIARERALCFDATLPMKTTLLADVESFKKQENTKQSQNSDFLMFIGSSVADAEDSLMESSAGYDTNNEVKRILHQKPPKETVGKRSRSRSPEQEANITRNDVLEAIYNTQHDEQSNEENGETDQDGSGDFADDFSADVDNYNVNNNIDRSFANSPHSIPKSEENFWDS